uniref:Uncharacterized protein n=1 Tax=viral metagenome TaxID=1070528 RepID=A0A6M3K0C8_9ZZZZ
MTKEDYNGSDCTISSGDVNRVLTLSNNTLTSSETFQVFVEGNYQTEDTDYTVSHKVASTTITFLASLYDDSPITVFYGQSLVETTITPSPKSILSTRFIQKNINIFGNSCTLIEIAKTTGIDEYRLVTETETEHENIGCYVHILNESDEEVKEGSFKSGDISFWFDSSNESYCVNGNRITFDSKTYEISEVQKVPPTSTTYLLKCQVKQI